MDKLGSILEIADLLIGSGYGWGVIRNNRFYYFPHVHSIDSTFGETSLYCKIPMICAGLGLSYNFVSPDQLDWVKFDWQGWEFY